MVRFSASMIQNMLLNFYRSVQVVLSYFFRPRLTLRSPRGRNSRRGDALGGVSLSLTGIEAAIPDVVVFQLTFIRLISIGSQGRFLACEDPHDRAALPAPTSAWVIPPAWSYFA